MRCSLFVIHFSAECSLVAQRSCGDRFGPDFAFHTCGEKEETPKREGRTEPLIREFEEPSYQE